MISRFTEHPKSVGESYSTHFKAAFSIAMKLLLASLCQAIHAMFPMFQPPSGADAESLVKLLEARTGKNKHNLDDEFLQKYHSGR